MRVLIALLLAAPALNAQETFSDPDFEYSMSLPAGMVLTTPEEQAAASGQPVESFVNVPRSESPDGEVSHVYRWRDASERDRNISLLIEDGPFPFSAPEQFKEAVELRMQVAVDQEQSLAPPEFKYGMRIEGLRTRSDGAIIRQTDVFLPISGDPPRYALLRMDCLDVDWSLMWPDFLSTLKSIDMPQPTVGAARPPPTAGRRRRGADVSGSATGDDQQEDWDTLEVTGSLILSALLLMGLFLGGRNTPPA
jgi:hypothetical protein